MLFPSPMIMDTSNLHTLTKFICMPSPDSCTYDLSYLTPIDRLPVELLIDIFVHCAQNSEDEGFIPLKLSHVSHVWRDIVHNSRCIWQYISLDDRRPQVVTDYQTQLWLARSGTLPLDIRIHVSNQDMLLPILLPLLPHVGRWRRFTLSGKVNEDTDFVDFSRGSFVTGIEKAHITLLGQSDLDEVEPGHHTQIFSSQPSQLPSHRSVNLSLAVLSLPPPHLMTTFQLKQLAISENVVDAFPSIVRMLEFLSFCPSMEIFKFYGFPYEPHRPEPDTDVHDRPPIVSLPRLRVLVIRTTCVTRTILSHIHAPNLRELNLEHTNMEFDPTAIPEYPYGVEDGDSDDEARDFSQSPWSDHAMGMGLRSLISRSNPPLEVLMMDYADIRTKDFLWCFDRLKDLQEFRIVASDMSDKVIGMLAPFRDVRAPSYERADDDEVEGDRDEMVEDSRPLKVRMPKLSVLELWNCQRLSGDAVVHALQARARYTDRIADGDEVCKLVDVAVIGCQDFLPRHINALSFTLGSRLRTF